MTAAVEVKKSVPVIADVDVLVAGAGHAGCTAALAAARSGTKTMLVDRFGSLGGNIGPGMIMGAPNLELPDSMADGMPGIPGEFVRRCESYLNAPLLNHYFRDSQVISYVWLKMMKENGVQVLLDSWVADPIMEGNRVAGLLVENKSGTQAIRAKVVIDATGDADVAYRAGAPTDDCTNYSNPGLYFAMANVDISEYHARVRNVAPEPEDMAWAQQAFEAEMPRLSARLVHLKPLIRYFRPAWESGEYRIVRKIGEYGYVTSDHGLFKSVAGVQDVDDPLPTGGLGIIGALAGVYGPAVRSGNAEVMTVLELGVREYIFETAQFLRRRVPGFEKAYLHMISPYFHARGGRSIISEHPVTVDDVKEQRHMDDVVLLGDDPEKRSMAQGEASRSKQRPYDFPYRQFLPRGVEGLLVTGRAAIIQPPGMRVRWMVFLMGQAAGIAAALAARDGKSPREIDVRELQQILYTKHNALLGDASRLQQLGLA